MSALASAAVIGEQAYRDLVERTIGRQLRQAETAIDVIALDTALERAKDELERAIRDEMLAAASAWVAGVASRPFLRVTPGMLRPLEQLRETGRLEALAEMTRLGYTGVVDPAFSRENVANPAPGPDRDVEAYLRRELPGIGVRIEDELIHAELGPTSQTVLIQALANMPGARDIASRVVSTALMDGRDLTFEANQDLVLCWEYTAVLDAATCSRCRPFDGQKYKTLAELFVDLPNFGPNPLCRGGGRCRCTALPCSVDEAGQAFPEGLEPELEPGVEPWRRELAEIRRREFAGAGNLSGADLQRLGKVSTRDRPSGVGFDLVPSEGLAEDEAAILRAGELLDVELDNRIGGRLAELDRQKADVVIEPHREAYKQADETYRAAIRQADAEEKALTEAIRLRIAGEEPGLEPWEIYKRVRADDELIALKARHTERLLELQKAKAEPMERLQEARRRAKALEGEIAATQREGLLELLAEVREMGGEPGGPAWKYATSGTRGKAKERLEQAADLFPRDWIVRSRSTSLLPKWRERARAHYSGGEIVVSGGDRSKVGTDPNGFATAIHELGHHVEHTDGRVTLLEFAFYHRRTRTPGYGPQEADVRFPKGTGYGQHETYRPDAFSERYMGKTYGNGARSSYELLTMGLEGLWTGSYDLDPEYRRFIIGLLAVV